MIQNERQYKIANHYRAVGFVGVASLKENRLQEVMSALDITIGKTVMQLGNCHVN
jgi:hypothetical protein